MATATKKVRVTAPLLFKVKRHEATGIEYSRERVAHGRVVELDAADADRYIELGVAEEVTEESETESDSADEDPEAATTEDASGSEETATPPAEGEEPKPGTQIKRRR